MALALAPSVAGAEGGFALNKFEPTPAGDVFIAVPSPFASGHLSPKVHTVFDYAARPVRYRLNDTESDVVASQGFMRLDASLALWNRVLVSVDAPLAIMQSGEDPGLQGTTFQALAAPKLGDIRFGLRIRLAGAEAGPFQLGVGGYVHAPTGTQEQYTGDGSVRGWPHLSMGGRVGGSVGFAYSLYGGAQLHASSAPHTATYGAAAALLLGGDTFQIGPEFYGFTPLNDKTVQLAASPVSEATTVAPQTNLELLVTAKVRVLGGLTFGGGAGPGLLSAVGTPTFRAVGMLGWAPLAKRKKSIGSKKDVALNESGDRDDDGISDDLDACPDSPGQPSADPAKDGCPTSDKDGDGVLDLDDACPATPGEPSKDPSKTGCPPDSDGDRIADAKDACPEKAGSSSDDPKKNGCPQDDDGDGIANRADDCPNKQGVASVRAGKNGCPAEKAPEQPRSRPRVASNSKDPDADGIVGKADACPGQPGSPDSDPAKNGCPKFTKVTEGEILINRKILFMNGGRSLKHTVSSRSYAILREVKAAINADPSIEMIEVQGHTDDNGTQAFNERLSRVRAKIVRNWLIAQGVPKSKLMAKGYGFMRPIADNRHRLGRRANRRVQFVIIKRSK